jgi:hypothetical protein
MLRCWLGEVGECDGKGIWRTEWGVGIGVVDTDIPGPYGSDGPEEEGGRSLVGRVGVLPDASLEG